MPIPQVTDRIKEAPALALRALFAGVGQLLLAADKVRTRAVDQLAQAQRSRPGTAAGPVPAPAASLPTATPGEAGQASDASLAATGTAGADATEAVPQPGGAPGEGGTAGRGGKPAAAKRPATKPRATATPADGKRPGSKPRAPGKPAPTALPARKPPAAAEPAGDVPPLPNYDDLSVASLRARMRVLDATALRALIAYEKAHSGREAVIAMFERRLAKLGGEET